MQIGIYSGHIMVVIWWCTMLRGTVVERRSLTGGLANFPCPALDLQLMGDH